MKLSTECIPCLLKRVAYEVELCAPDRVMRALKECSRIASEMASNEISSAEFASHIHKCAYEIIGSADPYAELKRRSNEVALQLLPEAEQYVASSENPIRAAMTVSIIGNILDFGISGSIESPEELGIEFRRILAESFGCDDSAEIVERISRAKTIMFLADNCGEMVLDKILLQQLKSSGAKIVLVVKGQPILTDVTREELNGLGIEDCVDEILETEDPAIGVNLWDSAVNADLRARMNSVDLIISKGMANFEALSEHEWNTVAYLLRAKCDTVARSLGVPRDTNVIRLVRGRLETRRG